MLSLIVPVTAPVEAVSPRKRGGGGGVGDACRGLKGDNVLMGQPMVSRHVPQDAGQRPAIPGQRHEPGIASSGCIMFVGVAASFNVRSSTITRSR